MTLCSSNRPPIRSDASTAVKATLESGVRSSAGTVSARAQTSRSDNGEQSPSGVGEPDSPSCRRLPISSFDGLGVFQTRTIFYLPRRASSGYFSSSEGDSLPSSPLSPRPVTADRATQTPSPSGQVMQHALQRVAEAYGGGPGTHQRHGEHLA